MGRGEARTGPPGAASSRGRRVLPPLVLAALAAVTVAAALLAWRAEVQDQAQADAAVAHEAADRAGAVFDGAFGLLRGVRGLYLASDRVSPEEFARFVTGAGERSALRSVACAPLVPPAARAAWERAAGRPVVAPGPDGRPRPVPATATALPIQEVSPPAVAAAARGLDLLSGPSRDALAAVVAGRRAEVVSAPVRLGSAGRPTAMVAAVAVGGGPAPRGVVAGAVRPDALAAAIRTVVPAGAAVRVRDGATTLVAIGPVPSGGAERTLVVAGRRLTVTAAAPGSASPLVPLGVALVGMGLTVAVGLQLRSAARGRRSLDLARRRMVERDRAEDALRASEARARAILEGAEHGVVVSDTEGIVESVNPAAERIFAAPARELVGTHLTTLLAPVPPVGPEREVEGIRPDRSPLVVAVSSSTAVVAGRALVTRIVRDVTDRVQAERRLAEREAAFRLLAENASDVILRVGPDARVRYRSPSGERLLGDAGPELWDGVHPEDLPAVRAAVRRVLSGAEGAMVTYRARGLDGRWLWFEAAAAAARDGDGTLREVQWIARDVTARHQADEERAAISRVSTAIAHEGDPAAVFALVAREVAALLGTDAGLVVRFADGAAVVAGAAGPADLPVGRRLPLAEGAIGAVAATGRPAADPRSGGPMGRAGVPATVAAPVHVAGRAWGAVVAAAATPPAPGAEARLGRFAELVGIAIANAEARAQLVVQATTDPLTGLANHRTFHERLGDEAARARRFGRPLSLILMDLDHFKEVNDVHGHQVGDGVLTGVADLLRRHARAADVLGRVGGEEFAWLLPEAAAEVAERAAERLREAMAGHRFPVAGVVTLSLGVCELGPGEEVSELYRRADVALYWAKAAGRNRCASYPQAVEQDLPRRPVRAAGPGRWGLRALRWALRAADPALDAHSGRVADLASGLATALGWPAAQVARLHEAGLVHEAGRLAAAELGERDAGPGRLAELGAAVVGEVLGPAEAAWVRGQAERWDGRGGPDGLAGEHIPDGARLLAVADAWDRGQADGPVAALALVRQSAGTALWPAGVDALARLVAEGATAPRRG